MKCYWLDIVLVACLMTLGTFIASAQSKPAAGPICRFTPATLDFGAMNTGQMKTDSVTVFNPGTTALDISSVTTSSSEFILFVTEYWLSPMDSARIVITCLPCTPGDKAVLIVFTDNTLQGKDTLTVTVKAVGDTLLPNLSTPSNALDFGIVPTCTTKTDSLVVTNTGRAPLIIKNVSQSHARFTVTPVSAVIAVNASSAFAVSYSPVTAGPDTARFFLWHNAAGGKNLFTASAAATGPDCRPSFSAVPHDFGAVQTGVTKTDSITITNDGTAGLIFSVKSHAGDCCFSIVPSTGWVPRSSSLKIAASFYTTTPGLKHSMVTLDLNTITGRDSISFTAIGIGDTLKPQCAISKTTIDFGAVLNGKQKRDSIVISNPGTLALQISSVSSTNASFTVFPPGGGIPPASSQKFFITFAPQTDGIKTGKIFFSHNAGPGKDSLSVTGEGTGGVGVPLFSATPRLLQMDSVPYNTFALDSFVVWNHGRATLHVSRTTKDNQYFSSVPSGFNVPVDSFVTVRVYFNAMFTRMETVHFVLASDAPSSPDTVTVIVKVYDTGVKPVLTLSSQEIDFGIIGFALVKADSVRVTNTGNTTLKITKIQSKDSRFFVNTTSLTLQPAEAAIVKIVFQPNKLGDFSSSIIFNYTTEPYSSALDVHGICDAGTPTPTVLTEPQTLDFRGILRNTVKLDSVFVYNFGRSLLHINSISSSNSTFTPTMTTTDIPPHEFTVMRLAFFPRDTVQQTGNIILTSNTPKTFDTVFVTGHGLLFSDIQSARTAANGAEVAVQGIITRAEGNWARLQDQTGAIAIRQTDGRFFNAISAGEVRFGDYILVQGRTSEYNAMKVIADSDFNNFEVISRQNPLPAPIKATLADIAASGETYESRLISVIGLTIESAGDVEYQSGKSYRITDRSDRLGQAVALRIPPFGDTYINGLPFLSENVDYIGVLAQNSSSSPDSGYELFPILVSDLREGSTGADEPSEASAQGFAILPNYPNPFNVSTTLRYCLPEPAVVTLEVHDMLGRVVARVVDHEYMSAGRHSIRFNAGNLPSGVYTSVLTSSGLMQKKLMLVVR
jgi:hypothetical protein